MQISEVFYSIQGEGLLAGTPSFFIRAAGCNRRCVWCDASYAWRGEEGEAWTVDRLAALAAGCPSRHVVVTGGEPLLQPDLPDLVRRLRDLGRHVTIETNATIPPPAGLACDLASLSPKLSHARSGPPMPAVVRDWIDSGNPFQLKFVVAAPDDLQEIDDLLRAVGRDVPPDRILLMPEGTTSDDLRRRSAAVVEACKARGYRYGMRLQIELFGNVRGT